MKESRQSKGNKWQIPLLKFYFGKAASGRFFRQLLLLVTLFLLVFVVAVVVRAFSLQEVVSRQGIKETLIDMMSSSSLVDYVQGKGNPKGSGWVFLLIYLCGMVFFSGLLIATITNMLSSYGERFNSGMVNYRNLKNHILFIGYDDMVMGVLNQMSQQGVFAKRHVVIALQQDVALFRTQVVSRFPSEYANKLILIQANLTDENDLKSKLKVHKAAKVYIIGCEDMESHDSLNVDSFIKICRITDGTEFMPHCYVNFQHQSSFSLFQVYSAQSDKSSLVSKNDIEFFECNKRFFHPFNFEEVWARKVLANLDGSYNGFEIDIRTEFDDNGVMVRQKSMNEIADGFVHVVIYGMSEMAEAFVKELAFLAHYPNFVTNREARTRITIVDENLQDKMYYFMGRYSEFFKHCHVGYTRYGTEVAETDFPIKPENDFLDMEFEFIEANNSDPRFGRQLEEWCMDKKQLLTMVVCYEDTFRNNAAGLYLPRVVYENDVPVLIYQRNKGSLGEFLSKSRYSNIRPFGMADDVLDLDESVEVEWAKRLNHFYCSNFKSDYSDREKMEEEWNEIKISDRWSSLYNVASIPFKYRGIGCDFQCGKPLPAFTPEQLDLLERVEHNRWNAEKLLMGYRPATEEERKAITERLNAGDSSLKTMYKSRFVHSDIVPLDDLGKDAKGYSLKGYDRLLCAEYAAIVNA